MKRSRAPSQSHGSFQDCIASLNSKTCSACNGVYRCFDFVYTLVFQLYGITQHGLQRLANHSSTGQSAVAIIKIAVALLGSVLVVEFFHHTRPYYWMTVNMIVYLIYVVLMSIGTVLLWTFNVVYGTLYYMVTLPLLLITRTATVLINVFVYFLRIPVVGLRMLLHVLKCLIRAIFNFIWLVFSICFPLCVGAFLSAQSGSPMNTGNHSTKAAKPKIQMIKSGVQDATVSLGSDEPKAARSGSSVINKALAKPSPITGELSERKDYRCKYTGHVHEDNPDAHICIDFLLDYCQNARKCSGHHCTRPFHWQYKVPRSEEWKSFSEKDNDTLEKLFCDPTQDRGEVKGLQIYADRVGCRVSLEDMDVVTWDDLLTTRKKTLRRMSTESCVTNPSSPLATKWTWYWQDEYGCWREYGNDQEGRDLQQQFEEAFLNKQTSTYKFTISAQGYKLDFHSTPMNQQNLHYGTTRLVRRRPKTFRSEEDMQQLKRNRGSKRKKKPEKRGNLPSHWSLMSRGVQYIREKLSSSSMEFREVETLFKNTMYETVSVVSIERVQNPFMWEKYCRKKENIAAAKTTDSNNEKRLFHGTSPEAVVAICKQNFDWRLNGKNATVYGEGSYFAVNASYSHSYAKQDDDSCQYMFLANVLVGSCTKGHRGLRRPPAINPSNPESDLYDSCVDNMLNPTIFVVFDTDQFYPAYIIKYSSKSRAYSAVPSYSLGARGYSGTPGHSSGSWYQSSSATSVPLQSSHAIHGNNSSPSVTQVYSPQHRTSSGRSGSATGTSFPSRDVLSLNAQLARQLNSKLEKPGECSIM